VNKKIDSGNIIKQKKIKILKKDDTESLTKKILIEEHKLYPKALNVVVKKLLLNKKIND
jgi:folate-dependent phosphoribosylglycinamide formyltransferase PurN